MSVLAAGMVLGQLAAVAPPAGDAPILNLGDRSEARVRTRVNGSGVAEDVETTPVVALSMRGTRTDWSLAYAAHLAYLDVAQAPNFIVAHSARLSAGYLWTRRLRIYASADGSIGEQFTDGLVASTNLGQTAPTATRFAPPVAVLDSVSYRAEVGEAYRLSRRWDLLTAAAYGGGQGLDDASRAIVPPYHGPSGYVTVGYTASRSDRLATSVSLSYTVSPTVGSRFFDTALYETWTHTFSERTIGFVGAGVAWQLSHAKTGAAEATTVYPDGELGVTHTVPLGAAETLTFRASSRVGLRYDAVLQASEPQASAVLSAIWASVHFGASTTVDAMTTLPSDPPGPSARQVSGGFVLWYSPTRLVRFETGARAYVQDLPDGLPAVGANVPNDVQWAAFLALALQAPPIEL